MRGRWWPPVRAFGPLWPVVLPLPKVAAADRCALGEPVLPDDILILGGFLISDGYLGGLVLRGALAYSLPMAPGFRVELSLSLAGGDCYLRGGRLSCRGGGNSSPIPWCPLGWRYYGIRCRCLRHGPCLPRRPCWRDNGGRGPILRRAPRSWDRQPLGRQGGKRITLCCASGATSPGSEASHDRRGEHITLCSASGVTSPGVLARARRWGGAHNALQCERCDFPRCGGQA